MRTIAGQIEIARPIEEVFDFVADETNEPRYNHDMWLTTHRSAPPLRLPMDLRAFVCELGKRTYAYCTFKGCHWWLEF